MKQKGMNRAETPAEASSGRTRSDEVNRNTEEKRP